MVFAEYFAIRSRLGLISLSINIGGRSKLPANAPQCCSSHYVPISPGPKSRHQRSRVDDDSGSPEEDNGIIALSCDYSATFIQML